MVGPTGIGKTRTAFELARRLGGDVVVADSRQVYRRLDIATNKPPDEYRAAVRYHGIDLADPVNDRVSAHDWLEVARPAIDAVTAAGRVAIVEGGTMLWVDALTEGYDLASTPPDPERRAELAGLPVDVLADLVRARDPDAVRDWNNRARLVRALEVLEAHGPPVARRRAAPAWRVVRVGLEAPIAVIERRLAARCAEQVARGLVQETRGALAAGVGRDAPVLTGIGYAEALAHIDGRLDAAALPAAMLRSNRRYARRQLAWFRRDPATRWFPAEPDPLPDILSFLETLT